MYRYYIIGRDKDGKTNYPVHHTRYTPVFYGTSGTTFDYIKGAIYGYVEYEEKLPEHEIASYGLLPGPVPSYYYIDEELARRAHDMMSLYDYHPGSKTSEYRRCVDNASMIAERQKRRVDLMYHEKIDRLLDSYARRLAENMNAESNIGTRCPSILIAGGSNFPVRKKEKQNAAMDRNRAEWCEIQGILGKIKSVGTGGISSDDPQAVEKLKAKLEGLVKHQETMKAANAAIRMKDAAKGDARLAELGYNEGEIKRLREPDFCGRIGYPSYELTNNNANIRRIKARIANLEKRASEGTPEGWEFDGGRVVMNTAENRLQILFEDKPDAGLRSELKRAGFRWAPSRGAWQRQLTDNAINAIKRINAVAPGA